MGVSTHPADSTIVISLWQGDTCTGTFRIPAKDAAQLISTLAYGMTEALPGHPTSGHPTEEDLVRGRLARVWSNLFRRVFVRQSGATESHLRLLE